MSRRCAAWFMARARRNLVSAFDNDHMLWMFQSHLEACALGPLESSEEGEEPTEENEAKLRAMSVAHSSDR